MDSLSNIQVENIINIVNKLDLKYKIFSNYINEELKFLNKKYDFIFSFNKDYCAYINNGIDIECIYLDSTDLKSLFLSFEEKREYIIEQATIAANNISNIAKNVKSCVEKINIEIKEHPRVKEVIKDLEIENLNFNYEIILRNQKIDIKLDYCIDNQHVSYLYKNYEKNLETLKDEIISFLVNEAYTFIYKKIIDRLQKTARIANRDKRKLLITAYKLNEVQILKEINNHRNKLRKEDKQLLDSFLINIKFRELK